MLFMKGYEIIVEKHSSDINKEEYEEILLEDFIKRENLSNDEVQQVLNQNHSCNIHFMLAEQTYEKALEIIEDIKNDSRLKKLNAIVFLSLKQKGRGENFTTLSFDKYKVLIQKCFDSGIRFGFDSCSCRKFEKALEDIILPEDINKEQIIQSSEPCESTKFSSYCNVEGEFFPCSFAEKEGNGLDILNCNDFLKDIWYHPTSIFFREKLQRCNRNCPLFSI